MLIAVLVISVAFLSGCTEEDPEREDWDGDGYPSGRGGPGYNWTTYEPPYTLEVDFNLSSGEILEIQACAHKYTQNGSRLIAESEWVRVTVA